jgi:SAM-dependent methyltransferase
MTVETVDRVADAARYEVISGGYDDALFTAAAIPPAGRVLDIGCGYGTTSRRAARLAAQGSVLGNDIAEPLLAQARAFADAEGVENIVFEAGDAQTHPFPGGAFDVAISRFGTMFFADPPAAFGNIAGAVKPGGRLVMLVWQPAAENEWDAAISAALGGEPNATAVPGLDPFSLGDRQLTGRYLADAGFADVEFQDVREPVLYGRDVEDALAFVRGFSCTRARLEGQDESAALDRLRTTLTDHQRPDGVWFEAAAWVVTALRSA